MLESKAHAFAAPPVPGPGSDEALLRAWLGGDESVLRELFGRHCDPLCALGGYLAGGGQRGEELARRAMVKVFCARRRLPGRQPLALGLRRQLVREFRRHQRWRAVLRLVGLRPPLRPRRILPLRRLAARRGGPEHERREAAVKALALLPPRLREVVALCDLEGRTYEEAAAILGGRPRRIGLRLGRGRGRFTAAFQRLLRS